MGVRANIVSIGAVDLFSYRIEERLLCYRIDEQPAVDGSAVTGKSDALIEHLLSNPTGENKPVVPLRCVVERRINISLRNERPPILGERGSNSIRDAEDA